MINWALKFTQNLLLAICPDSVKMLAIESDVLKRVKIFLSRSPWFVAYGFTLLLLILEFQTIFRMVSIRRMSSLSAEKQREIFKELMEHRFLIFSGAVKIVKTIVDIAFYDHPKIRQRMNYKPEEYIAFVKNRRIEKYGERP